jgi:hypothetical protein
MIIKIKLNSDIPHPKLSCKTYKKGSVIEIEADEYGTPLDRFWYRRLKDSSVEIVKEEIKEKKVNIKRVKDAK